MPPSTGVSKSSHNEIGCWMSKIDSCARRSRLRSASSGPPHRRAIRHTGKKISYRHRTLTTHVDDTDHEASIQVNETQATTELEITSGLFAANCAWLGCAVIAHNLLRAAGTLAGGNHAVARGATLRRDLVNVPARFAAPARKPTLHLPAHWPWQTGWTTLWDNVIGYPTAQPRAA